MKRYYIFRESQQIAATATREEAVSLIRMYQQRETHYLLRAEFSIIYGTEEFVSYPTENRKKSH